jgi:flagellar basal-body rod protein FlgB
MNVVMKINPFAHHEQALHLRAMRNEILSSNIANADTPNYKARDIDFRSAFQAASSEVRTLRTSDARHMPVAPGQNALADVQYRLPMQPSVDGNTVEVDIEQAQFAENTVRYRASLSFLSSQISGLRYAIKGGD